MKTKLKIATAPILLTCSVLLMAGPVTAGSYSTAGTASTVGSHSTMEESHSKSDIVGVAIGAGNFNTLIAAIDAAGLTDTLKGDGPFTVFAPSDEAFAKIPQDKLDALLQDKQMLTQILTYHVVPGRVMSEEVVTSKSLTSVEGRDISVNADGGVKVDDANVIMTDIVASNGIIHVIDSVILPN